MCPIWLPLLSVLFYNVIAGLHPSSRQCRGSNSQPLDHEPSALTTRPWFLAIILNFVIKLILNIVGRQQLLSSVGVFSRRFQRHRQHRLRGLGQSSIEVESKKFAVGRFFCLDVSKNVMTRQFLKETSSKFHLKLIIRYFLISRTH
jgi:hypothetical protein